MAVHVRRDDVCEIPSLDADDRVDPSSVFALGAAWHADIAFGHVELRAEAAATRAKIRAPPAADFFVRVLLGAVLLEPEPEAPEESVVRQWCTSGGTDALF